MHFGTRAGLIGVLAICLAVCSPWSFAQQPAGPVHVVTHIDIMPNFAEDARELLAAYAAQTRQDEALVSYDLLVQDSRPNHFAVVEVWQSRQEFEAHAGHDHSLEFREKLQPMLGSPFDVRLHSAVQ